MVLADRLSDALSRLALLILVIRGWDVALIHILIERFLADRLIMDVDSSTTA
jgi:hypothetical protein